MNRFNYQCARAPGLFARRGMVALCLLLFSLPLYAESDPRPFVSVWDTRTEFSEDNRVIEIVTSGDAELRWSSVEDPSIQGSQQLSGDESAVSLQFPVPGVYRVEVTPGITAFRNDGGREQLREVVQWGDVAWQSLDEMFHYSEGVVVSDPASPQFAPGATMVATFRATHVDVDLSNWDTSNVVSIQGIFELTDTPLDGIENWDVSNVTRFGGAFSRVGVPIPSLSSWDVSSAESMFMMFGGLERVPPAIANWDVGNARDMSLMFVSSNLGDLDLGAWDVSQLTDVYGMFVEARGDLHWLADWELSSVTSMEYMFGGVQTADLPISDWDVSSVTNMRNMFSDAQVQELDLGAWDMSAVTDTSGMLAGWQGDLSWLANWDVSSVEDMSRMFADVDVEALPIGDWDIGAVRSMSELFRGSRVDNLDLSAWDVSSVTHMAETFARAEVPMSWLASWDVSSVVDMSEMFADGQNQVLAIADWNVSAVTDMRYMFDGFRGEAPELANWDVAGVTTMRGMFRNADMAGLDVAAWDVSNVTDMGSMFAGFRGPLPDVSSWDVSNVVDMDAMFQGISGDSPSLSQWDVSSVEDMRRMFEEVYADSLDIAGWDVSNVRTMDGMFARSSIDQFDLTGWDIAGVTSLEEMFDGARSFDQDLSAWDFSEVQRFWGVVDNSGLSVQNYDRLLIAIEATNNEEGVYFGGNGMAYCDARQARQRLKNRGWYFFGDYEDCGQLTLSGSGFDLGATVLGQTLDVTAEIINTNDVAVVIADMDFSDDTGQISLDDESCLGSELAPGQSCTLRLQSLSDQAGLVSAPLTVRLQGQDAGITFPVTLLALAERPDINQDWRVEDRVLSEDEKVYMQHMYDVLALFYYRMGGDNWVNNQGWLDAAVHPCEWYGVVCYDAPNADALGGWRAKYGQIQFRALALPGNNLTGELTDFSTLADMLSLPEQYAVYPERVLDLRGNQISSVKQLPVASFIVLLDNNRLAGALPPTPSVSMRTWASLHYLSLAGNEFTGQLPDSWTSLEFVLAGLDLSENGFTGSAVGFERLVDMGGEFEAVFATAAGMPWREDEFAFGAQPLQDNDLREAPRLGLPAGALLAGNQFEGLLDIYDQPGSRCWNRLGFNVTQFDEAPGPTSLEGKTVADCQYVERKALDAAVNGSWYDPARSGEGMNLLLLENGTPFAIWYMHAEAGRQVWMLGQGQVTGQSLRFAPMSNFQGVFGEGYDNRAGGQHRYTDEANGFGMTLEANQLGDNVLAVGQMADFGNAVANNAALAGQQVAEELDGQLVPYQAYSPLRELTRLTAIAGTSCDNRHEHQWVSGLWYEPASDGEGLMIEYTSNDQAVVYWYTYTPDGEEQAWMLGVGTFDGQRLVVENMRQPQHTGEVVFDTAGIEQDVTWGSLEIDFSDQSNGVLSYTSVMDGYGSGTRELTKLASPMMASGCEASVH